MGKPPEKGAQKLKYIFNPDQTFPETKVGELIKDLKVFTPPG